MDKFTNKLIKTNYKESADLELWAKEYLDNLYDNWGGIIDLMRDDLGIETLNDRLTKRMNSTLNK
jgi:hypothetical protein